MSVEAFVIIAKLPHPDTEGVRWSLYYDGAKEDAKKYHNNQAFINVLKSKP